jgi:hypothetical protein
MTKKAIELLCWLRWVTVIDFWMKLNNMDFGEALYDLDEKLGVS